MADIDNGLKLGVDLDLGGAQSDAKTLGETLKQMGAMLVSAYNAADKAQQKAASSAAKAHEAIKKQEIILANLKSKYDQLKSGDITPRGLKQIQSDAIKAEKEFNRLADAYDAAMDKVSSLDFGIDTQQLRQARIELEAIKQEMAEAAQRADELKARAEAVRLNPEAAPEAQKLAAEIGLAGEKLSRLKAEADAVSAAAENLGRKFFKIPDFIRSAASGIASFGKKTLSVFGSIGGAIKNVFTGAGKRTKGYGSLFERTFNRIKGLVVRAALFSVIYRGLRAVVQEIGAYIKINRDFTRSLQVSKGNLLTAFQPILEAVMPALTALGNGLVYVTGLLAQFISLLTGKSISQMQSSAKAASNEAKAIKAVGQEAKKAKGELYSFDEVNKQVADTASGGSGGAASPIFELPTFDTPAWIKDITLNIKAGNWEQAGKALADSLNSVVAKIEFDTIGANIGTGLQKAFEFGLGFLRNVNTQAVGEGLGTALNGIFTNLSPETVGASFGAFWNRVVDIAYGFVTETDWSKIGAWFGDAVNGFFKEFDFRKLGATIGDFVKGVIRLVSDFVLTTDWESVGHSFWEVLTEIDWSGIVEEMARLLGRAIGGMGKLLWGFIKDAAKDIGDYFHDEIEEAGGNVPLGLWNGIIKGLGSIADWLWEHIGKPIIEGVMEMFGIHSPSTVFEGFGENLIQGLVDGIENTLSKISEVLSEIKTMFTDGFKGILNGVLVLFEDAINWIIGNLNKIQFTIPDWVPAALGGGKSFGVNIPPVKLPRLATGDVVQPGKEFLAILGDNKTEQEVVSPLSTIEEAVTRAMGGQEMVSLLKEILQAIRDGKVITVDRRVFGEMSSKYGKEYDGLRAVLT